eukprot:SAG11_NODE_445_length_9408_cov_3.801590_5_plen_54_part_00
MTHISMPDDRHIKLCFGPYYVLGLIDFKWLSLLTTWSGESRKRPEDEATKRPR